jgi:hypothetical protein
VRGNIDAAFTADTGIGLLSSAPLRRTDAYEHNRAGPAPKVSLRANARYARKKRADEPSQTCREPVLFRQAANPARPLSDEPATPR